MCLILFEEKLACPDFDALHQFCSDVIDTCIHTANEVIFRDTNRTNTNRTQESVYYTVYCLRLTLGKYMLVRNN